MDAGPLGPDAVPGHGHADTLSFELHAHGAPRLVDPGVVTYRAGPWRDRLRSAAAHNTVVVDGEDPCVFWGPFRVAFLPRARLLQATDQVFEGEHDGYRRLPHPVHHRRRLVRHGDGRFTVHDHLDGEGEHRFELGFQASPGAHLEADPDNPLAATLHWSDGVTLHLRRTQGPPATAHRDDGAVSGGWNHPLGAPRWRLRWRSEVPFESVVELEWISRPHPVTGFVCSVPGAPRS